MSEMDCFQNYTQCVCDFTSCTQANRKHTNLTSKLTMKCISTCGVPSDWKVTSDSRLSSGPGTNNNLLFTKPFSDFTAILFCLK